MSTYHIDLVNGNDSNTGADWANAWLTFTNGATAARIAPGDTIKVAKTGGLTSLGNATWNNLSKTVTLATSGLTKVVDNCESTWQTANGASQANQSGNYNKEGTYNKRIQAPASTATGTLYSYYNIADDNYSAYQNLSFWFACSSTLVAGNWKLCLCSNDDGTGIVDEFLIPVIPAVSTLQLCPLNIAKNGGGNLGSSIKSVALYSGTVAPASSSYVYLDHIIATTTTGISLQTLISKNSSEQGGSEPWFGIQSINDTTILLDSATSTLSSQGRGYHGTTETVATYYRETFKTSLASTTTSIVSNMNEGGTSAGGYITFSGGWNTSTNLQDGETFMDGLNGHGYGIYLASQNFLICEHINPVRYGSGFYFGVTNNCIIKNCFANNNLNGVNSQTNFKIRLENIIANNNGAGASGTAFQIQVTFDSKILNCIGYNSYRGFNSPYSARLTFINCIIKNNNLGCSGNGCDYVYYNLIESNNITFTQVSSFYSDIRYHRLNEMEGNHFIYSFGIGKIYPQQTTRHTDNGYAWKIETIGTSIYSISPIEFPLVKVLLEANVQKIIKVWCKKDHATNVGASLVIPEYQIPGMTTEIVDTKSDDTNWEELSVSITATETGVIQVIARSWYVAGSTSTCNTYWDDISIV